MSNQPSSITSNAPLKIVSCIIGYALWALLSQTYREELDVTMPVCFYNTPENYTITSPETVSIRLSGTRAALCTLAKEQPAVHLDCSTLHAGTNPMRITTDTLFLPDNVNVVHSTTTPLLITLTKNNHNPVPSSTQDIISNQQNT